MNFLWWTKWHWENLLSLLGIEPRSSVAQSLPPFLKMKIYSAEKLQEVHSKRYVGHTVATYKEYVARKETFLHILKLGQDIMGFVVDKVALGQVFS
jgi:hypothetical protein